MPKMKSNIWKAVIFDLDGTLVDTIQDIANAMNRVLRDYGFAEHPVKDYKDFVGYGLRITAKRALPPEARDDETVKTAGETLIRYYAEHPIDTTVPYTGIQEMLTGLKIAGVPTAILSNKAQSLVEKVVTDVLAGFSFTGVQGARDGVPLKPDPSSALEMAGKLGVGPENILFVGDSEVDIHTAEAAGMFPAAVAWGFRSPEFLKEAGAKILFQEPREIVTFMS